MINTAQLLEFLTQLTKYQENSETTLTLGDYLISYKTNEDGVSLEIHKKDESEEEFTGFDDSEIKEKITNYKECIEALSDDMFLDILDEMREVIDIKEMDELLELKTFTEENAARVEELIEHSTLIVQKYLQNKIQDCMELYEKFLGA